MHRTGIADCAGKDEFKGAGRPHPGICGESAEPFGEIFQREQGGNRDYVPGYGGYEESDIERGSSQFRKENVGRWDFDT